MPSEIISKHVEELPCRLTQEEWEERATRQADVVKEIEQHEGHEQQVKADLKATRTRLEAELAKLACQVKGHAEIRPITVEALADFRSGIVREVRVDTGEQVRTRALREEERQGSLKLHDDGTSAA